MWAPFKRGSEKDDIATKHATISRRMESVVRDKDEQIVALNRMLCDTIAERDSAMRDAAAARAAQEEVEKLRGRVEELQGENGRLKLEVATLQAERDAIVNEPAPSHYAPTLMSGSGRQYAQSVAGSLAPGRPVQRLTGRERAKQRDTATRAMILLTAAK